MYGVMIQPLYSFSGFVVGALVGLTGVGGGSLMTPLLILLFGIHPATAVGTDLLFAACTKTVGAAIHARGRTIDWLVVRRLAAGSIPATMLMVAILRVARPDTHMVSALVTPVLAGALLVTAVLVVFQKQVVAGLAGFSAGLTTGRQRGLTIASGVVLGVLVSLSSVGAGALGVTFLLLLYPALSPQRIVGSDIAHAIPLTLVAGAGYFLMGSIDWPMLGSLLVGSIPGIILGSLLATRAPVGVLRGLLAVVLGIAGGKLLM
jgi:uncharacterized membrane protein YfcA